MAKFFDRVHRESLELFDYNVFDEQWKKRKEGKGEIFLLCVGAGSIEGRTIDRRAKFRRLFPVRITANH